MLNRFTTLWIWGLFLTIHANMSAQVLTAERHMLNPSDSIVVFQLPYIAVGDSGLHCMWDFSSIEENIAVMVNYYAVSSNGEGNIVGKHQVGEHVYYKLKSDTIYIVGYENTLRKVIHKCFEPVIKFPFQYGDTISQNFVIKELWGHKNTQITNVCINIKADASGALILPTGNEDSVLRVHTHKEYLTENASVPLTYLSWKWYSTRHRHPIVESIKVLNGDSVTTAYSLYYPTHNQQKINRNEHHVIDMNDTDDNTADNVTCFPNPVTEDLSVSYSIYNTSTVFLSLYTSSGVCVYNSPITTQAPKHYIEHIPMNGLPQGIYTLHLTVNNMTISEEIIKK